MRLNYIKYFLKEGFKNVRLNGIMSIASVLVMVCCMTLTGIAVLMSMNISSTLKSIEGKNSITVYLDNDVDAAQVSIIEKKIKSHSNVLSCEYYPREEAVKKYEDMLGSLFDMVQGDENPLPDVFHITMHDLSIYEETVYSIKSIDGVKTVSDRSDTANKITSLNNLVSRVGFFIVVALGLVSLFIVANTIRITMYSRRFEISIMKSVGATNWFIRIPFMVEGMVIGFISAVISIGLLKVLYDEVMRIINKIIPFTSLSFNKVAWPTFLSFTISGMIFGLIGGVISISKYLKKEGGDVVAW